MPARTDGRRVDAATQANVRRLAVKAVRAGMTQTTATATFGVSMRAVNQWMAVDKSPHPIRRCNSVVLMRLSQGIYRSYWVASPLFCAVGCSGPVLRPPESESLWELRLVPLGKY